MQELVRGVSIPDMSVEAFLKTKTAFTPKKITDDMTLIAVGREAGRQEVIAFLERFVSESKISGNPKDLDRDDQELGYFQRLFRNVRRKKV